MNREMRKAAKELAIEIREVLAGRQTKPINLDDPNRAAVMRIMLSEMNIEGTLTNPAARRLFEKLAK